MKLSELIDICKSSPESRSSAFGIEVDEGIEDFDPPKGITEIGLLARFEDGEFADDVLDVTISYKMSPVPVSVILEITAEAAVSDIAHVVATVEAVNASASFLPPVDGGEAAFEAYCVRLEQVALAYCSRANFQESLYPVTSYFQYMVMDLLSPETASGFAPTDPYVVENFHSRMTVERSDAMKARIAEVIHECFTDEEGADRFREAMLGICRKELGDVEAITKEIASRNAPAAVAAQ